MNDGRDTSTTLVVTILVIKSHRIRLEHRLSVIHHEIVRNVIKSFRFFILFYFDKYVFNHTFRILDVCSKIIFYLRKRHQRLRKLFQYAFNPDQ